MRSLVELTQQTLTSTEGERKAEDLVGNEPHGGLTPGMKRKAPGGADDDDVAMSLATSVADESGIMGSLHSSWTEWKGYHFYVEAYGDLGMARAYYAPMHSTIITLDKPGGHATKKRNFYIGSIFREKFKGWQSTSIGFCTSKLAHCIKVRVVFTSD